MRENESPPAPEELLKSCIHDLRNNLGAILSGAKAMHKSPNNPEVCETMLQLVERNINQSVEQLNLLMTQVYPHLVHSNQAE